MSDTSRLIITKQFPLTFKWDTPTKDIQIVIYGALLHPLHFFRVPPIQIKDITDDEV